MKRVPGPLNALMFCLFAGDTRAYSGLSPDDLNTSCSTCLTCASVMAVVEPLYVRVLVPSVQPLAFSDGFAPPDEFWNTTLVYSQHGRPAVVAATADDPEFFAEL